MFKKVFPRTGIANKCFIFYDESLNQDLSAQYNGKHCPFNLSGIYCVLCSCVEEPTPGEGEGA